MTDGFLSSWERVSLFLSPFKWTVIIYCSLLGRGREKRWGQWWGRRFRGLFWLEFKGTAPAKLRIALSSFSPWSSLSPACSLFHVTFDGNETVLEESFPPEQGHTCFALSVWPTALEVLHSLKTRDAPWAYEMFKGWENCLYHTQENEKFWM